MFSRLVEGVVHNLRNHVWAIQGYLREIDTRKLPKDVAADLNTAQSAANDAATSLRNLSIGATPRVNWSTQPIDLSEVGRHALALVRNHARDKGAQLRLEEQLDLVVAGDPLLLREVVTNLLMNAIDAVPNGGRITLSTGSYDADSVYLCVADNGPGVAEEHRNRLFEPHFTTKPNGSGVGLFTSYGIVREHHGRLLYEGQPGRGAVFTVVLPRVSSSAHEPVRPVRTA
jgi:signal transduction histidine kinase